MGAGGSFPIDIVLFGMVAAFLVLRLRSILGRRQGFERPADAPMPPAALTPQAPPAPAEPAQERILPEPSSLAGQALARIAEAERGFEPRRFLSGAEGAFRMIVGAFAAGDRATLRNLLSEETLRGFESAIAAREAAGEAQRTDIQAIPTAAIEAAALSGKTAQITVRFVSDQVNITTGRDGQVVSGTDAVTEITDVWTFERELGSSDPSWRLVAARSA